MGGMIPSYQTFNLLSRSLGKR